MPTPDSNRRNLEHARTQSKVIFWRSRSESQRVKGDIAWLWQSKPGLSQRTVARMLHVSQPYVAGVLKRLQLSAGIEDAIGAEAYRQFRDRMEAERRAHFAAQGAPPSLVGENARESGATFNELQASATAPKPEAPGTEYVELLRSTNGEVIEGYSSRPGWARPAAPVSANMPQAPRSPCWQDDLTHVDAAILQYVGFNPNRSKGWF